jgi:hypothetical protein
MSVSGQLIKEICLITKNCSSFLNVVIFTERSKTAAYVLHRYYSLKGYISTEVGRHHNGTTFSIDVVC